jgi:glycosyltransferase involved in cell wall biosynthesis
VSLSVIIPCYRSAASLPILVERLLPVLEGMGDDYEVFLVVDGSPDNTWEVASQLAEAHPGVAALRLSRNYGQHNALLAGLRLARHDVTVTMDDDLQHLPEEIPKIVAALSPTIDLVYGVAIEEEHSWLRSAASRSVKAAMRRGMKIEGADEISAFRAFRTYLRDALERIDHPGVNLDVALSWATTRALGVPVTMQQRPMGRSNYTPRLLIRHALNMLLGYSAAPVRFVLYLGLVCGVFGVALLAFILYKYATGETTVAGFTTIASMVAIFSSAQMVALGLLGESIGRIHTANAGHPSYVIREQHGVASQDDITPEDVEGREGLSG